MYAAHLAQALVGLRPLSSTVSPPFDADAAAIGPSPRQSGLDRPMGYTAAFSSLAGRDLLARRNLDRFAGRRVPSHPRRLRPHL